MNDNQMIKKTKNIDELLKSRKEKRFETIYGALFRTNKTKGQIVN